MIKNIVKLLLLLLIAPLISAQGSYPKKLIIQNSKRIDTVIAYTNEQVIKINQEHVILKQCIEYSDIQDSTIKFHVKTIEELTNITKNLQLLNSISKEQIETQSIMLSSAYAEKKQLQESFTKYQKQTKKQNRRTWFYNGFITIPIVISVVSVATYFILK